MSIGAGAVTVVVVLLLVGLVAGGLAGYPRYFVWQQEMAGRAELVRADQNRQIAVTEAKAQGESAVFAAEAERIRARGVADANEIIGKSLQGNEAYLRYLWVQGLHDGSSEIIYVPTEANLPILEATRSSTP
jgi:regulator of protease activity HflC (stomatin/prohibitin superfamily)